MKFSPRVKIEETLSLALMWEEAARRSPSDLKGNSENFKRTEIPHEESALTDGKGFSGNTMKRRKTGLNNEANGC